MSGQQPMTGDKVKVEITGVVENIDDHGHVVHLTVTDSTGQQKVYVPQGSVVTVLARAEALKPGTVKRGPAGQIVVLTDDTRDNYAEKARQRADNEPRTFSSDGPPPPADVTVLEKLNFDSNGDPGRFLRRSLVFSGMWFWTTSMHDPVVEHGLFRWPPPRGKFREVQS